MRGMLVLVSIVAVLTVSAGVAVTVRERGGTDGSLRATATSRPASVTPSGLALATGTTAASSTNVPETTVGIATAATAVLPQTLPVKTPEPLALTGGLADVRAYYSETYTIDIFTIGWRPGAFLPERAEEVATAARAGLDHVNAMLGTNDNQPIEIFLADTLFNSDCWGCQGFAASDLRQIFILQDGSVAPNELPALLTHEIGHVVAGNAIALPNSLMFAEGFATWAMSDAFAEAGYLTPAQTAAWMFKVGRLPTLDQLRAAKYEGRTRARDEYDGAEAFTQFVVERFGIDAYRALYALVCGGVFDAPQQAVGEDWPTLEQQWHDWLGQYADNVVNGIDAAAWWQSASTVMAGFRRFYDDPSTVTVEQYAQLATARVALNRADVPSVLALMAAARLDSGAAN